MLRVLPSKGRCLQSYRLATVFFCSYLTDNTTHTYSEILNINTFNVAVNIFLGWNWVHLVRRPLFGLLYRPRMMDDDGCRALYGMRMIRETEVLGENPCPRATLSTINPTRPDWDRTRFAISSLGYTVSNDSITINNDLVQSDHGMVRHLRGGTAGRLRHEVRGLVNTNTKRVWK
jgi:hypothetical protein